MREEGDKLRHGGERGDTKKDEKGGGGRAKRVEERGDTVEGERERDPLPA